MKKLVITYCLLIAASGLSGQSRDAFLMKGSAELMKGMYAEASATLTLALRQWPGDEVFLLKQAEAYCMSGDYEAALAGLAEAGRLSPGSELFLMAKCYAMKGEAAAAINYLRRHLASTFRIPEDDVKKDAAFDALQRTDEWYDLWQEDWYTPAENVCRDALKMIGSGRYDEALALTGRAINAGIKEAGIYHARALAYYGKGDYGFAVADLNTAVNIAGRNVLYYEARGKANLKAGNTRAAISDYSAALQIKPDQFSAITGRAEAYAAAGSYSQALTDVRTYLSFFEDDAAVMLMCGDYLLETGDYNEALKYYNLLVERDKSNPIYYRQRGRANMLARAYLYAMQDLTMSLDLDPSDGKAWLYLGQTTLATGDTASSNSYFQKALRLGETEALKFLIENQ